MSFPISGRTPMSQPPTSKPKARLKTTEVAAEATGLPQETFKPTGNPIKGGLLQGKVAKKLGGKATDVRVTDYGITFKGKALDKLRETALTMGANAAEGAGTPLWAKEGIKQLHVSLYDTPQGPGEMDHPSGVISVPQEKASPAAQLGYLFAKG